MHGSIREFTTLEKKMAQEVAVPFPAEEEERRAPVRRLRKLFQVARQHPLGVLGLLFVALLLVCGVFANVVSPYDPLSSNRHREVGGSLVNAISANDSRISISKPDVGLGSSVTIGDEKIIILAVLSETGKEEALVQVTRGAGGTAAAAHPAGEELVRADVTDKLAQPSLSHPFGTDRAGQDVLSRTIWGARISLMIGLVSVTIGVTIGSLFGVVSGYFGGFVDSLIQRLVDMFLAFPPLVLLLAIITVIGDRDASVRRFLADYTPIPEGTFWGIPNFLQVFVISLAIGIAGAVTTSRIVRGAVLSLKENVYIEAARAIGASDRRVMWKHIFPNVAALVVVLATIFLPLAILAEAAISFLGLGVPYPTPSWGTDLSGQNRDDAFQEGAWWPAFFPGLALSLIVLGFNLVGDAFRDITDPRLRGGIGSDLGRR